MEVMYVCFHSSLGLSSSINPTYFSNSDWIITWLAWKFIDFRAKLFRPSFYDFDYSHKQAQIFYVTLRVWTGREKKRGWLVVQREPICSWLNMQTKKTNGNTQLKNFFSSRSFHSPTTFFFSWKSGLKKTLFPYVE